MTSSRPPRRPLLLGHRGARRSSPENTIPAFEQALSHGCEGFEFDVRLTADGKMIVCHDPLIRGIEVARSTYTSVLERSGDARPPLLEDVLRTFATRAYLDIELKVAGMEGKVAAALAQHPPQRGYLVSSFLPDALSAMKAREPRIPLGLICDSREQWDRRPRLPLEAVMPQLRLATRDRIEEAHRAQQQVLVWTVNSASDMRYMVEMGVDGIISDDTQLLVRTVGAR